MPDDSPGDAELSAADTTQLELWAFGRQAAGSDPKLAEAALLELARRAESAAATTTESTTSDELDTPAAATEPTTRARATRVTIGLAAGILIASIIAVVLLVTVPRSEGALSVFNGESTAAEELMGVQLEGIGQRVEAGPRELYEGLSATAVTYLSSSRHEGPVDLVCVAVIEPQGVGDSSCIARDQFVESGIRLSLYGLLGLYNITWDLDDAVTVHMPVDFMARPTGGARTHGDYRDVLLVDLTEVDRELGRVLGASGITVGAGPVFLGSLSSINGAPVGEQGVMVAWSEISPDPLRGLMVCLGVAELPLSETATGTVREGTCVTEEQMAEQGLRFETRFASETAVWMWNNDLGLRGSTTRL